MPFKLTILGSGSAVPTLERAVSAQYINFNERRILIDCGEGTQLQLRKYKAKFQRIQLILISHLHGDHFQGIFGLLASMNLLGRVQPLRIFAPPELEEIVRYHFKLTHVYLNYELEFVSLTAKDKTLVYEDKVLEVHAFPLKHRINCFGFLLKEKPRLLNIIPEKIEEFDLSLAEIYRAKLGEDIERADEVIPNIELTLPPLQLLQYAYCSDTLPVSQLAEWIRDVDLLYHEATFTEQQADRAVKTMHSTARQAAEIAKSANAGKLILGHFSARFGDTSPILNEAMEVFENVSCVEDGDEFIL